MSAGVHAQGDSLCVRRAGWVVGLDGCDPSRVPFVIIILCLSFLFITFLVLEKVVGDGVVHELQDCEVDAHVVLVLVVDRGVPSRLTCAKHASRERTQRAHAQGHRQSTRAPQHSPFYPGILADACIMLDAGGGVARCWAIFDN